MNELPAPLTPAECDLRDFPGMMINIPRLRASVFDATPDDASWRAGLNLWMSAFHEVPAASLVDDEATLCKAAGLGRDIKTWRKVRAAAMRGWVLCSDGRWYHPTVAEVALEAWLGKLSQRLASGAGNAKRHGTPFNPLPVRTAIQIAATLLTGLNPASKTLPKVSRHVPDGTPDGNPDGTKKQSARDADGLPFGSQVEEIVEEIGEGKRKKDASGVAPQPPSAPLKEFIRLPTNRFEKSGEEVVIYEPFVEEMQSLYPKVDVRAELRKMRGWLVTKENDRKTKNGMKRFINGWLSRQQDRPAPRETIGGRHGGSAKSPNQSFAAEIIRSIHEDDRPGGLFEGGGEIIDVTPAGPQARDRDEAA